MIYDVGWMRDDVGEEEVEEDDGDGDDDYV